MPYIPTDHQERETTREREYYRFEEATDIAERLGYAVDHTLSHQIFDGKVYDSKFVRIADYTRKSLDVAPALFQGDAAFEVERRAIEHEKTLRVEDLAAGRLGGNSMIEYSPAPREVLEGHSHINGYRPDLRRDFVRIYHAAGDVMDCRIFSLDTVSDHTRQKVGDWLGIDMRPGRSDGQVMRDDVVCDLTVDDIDVLVEMTKEIHDTALADERGGAWFAGSRFGNRDGALQTVLTQQDLMDEHMQVWSDIVGRALDRDAGNLAMDFYRKRTTAAIFARQQGMDVGSVSDSGVTTVMESNNFDAGCAIGSNESNTVTDMAMSRGRQEFVSQACPMCGERRVMTKIEGSIISGSCGCARDICTGKEISVNRKKRFAPDASDQYVTEHTEKDDQARAQAAGRMREAAIRSQYGEHARVRSVVGIGSSSTVVYDGRTNETIQTLD